MNRSLLVKLFGFPATMAHGDPLMLDRWNWLKKRLPRTLDGDRLIDIGCGTGAFSIGAARRGYKVLGLSWDERNQTVANERAVMCGAHSATFEILDVRRLDERVDLAGKFDVAICFENIEHIIDDRKLVRDITASLTPGGRLLLTTPQFFYHPISAGDRGSFPKVENGGHVRRGYTPAMLEELCREAGLKVERTSYCSGFLSQKVAGVLRLLSGIHPLAGWAATLPLRALPPVLDWLITPAIGWPYYCICLEAYKPRFPRNEKNEINARPYTTQRSERVEPGKDFDFEEIGG
jgi:SAM-dependent methyltransferase